MESKSYKEVEADYIKKYNKTIKHGSRRQKEEALQALIDFQINNVPQFFHHNDE